MSEDNIENLNGRSESFGSADSRSEDRSDKEPDNKKDRKKKTRFFGKEKPENHGSEADSKKNDYEKEKSSAKKSDQTPEKAPKNTVEQTNDYKGADSEQTNSLDAENHDPEQTQESELFANEAIEVADEIINSRMGEISSHLDSEGLSSEEEAEDLAAVAYLSAVDEHLSEGDDLSVDVFAVSATEALEDLGVEAGNIEPLEESEVGEPTEHNYDIDPSDGVDPVPEPQFASPQPSTNEGPQPAQNNPPIVPPPVFDAQTQSQTSRPVTPVPPPIYYGPEISRSSNNGPHSRTRPHQKSHRPLRRKSYKLGSSTVAGYVYGKRSKKESIADDSQNSRVGVAQNLEKMQKEIDQIKKKISSGEELVRAQARNYVRREIAKNNNTTLEEAQKNIQPQTSQRKIVQKMTDSFQENHIHRVKQRKSEKEWSLRRQKLEQNGLLEKMSETQIKGSRIFLERRDLGRETKRKSFEEMSNDQLLGYLNGVQFDGMKIDDYFYAKRLTRESLIRLNKAFWRKDSQDYRTVFYKELSPDPREIQRHRQEFERAQNLADKNQEKHPKPAEILRPRMVGTVRHQPIVSGVDGDAKDQNLQPKEPIQNAAENTPVYPNIARSKSSKSEPSYLLLSTPALIILTILTFLALVFLYQKVL